MTGPAVEIAAAGLRDGGTVAAGARIPFDGMMAVHRGAARQYRLYALLLVGFGVALVGLGLLAVLPAVPALVIGVVTAAVAVFPYRDMVERRERVEGLRVLQDEWRELAPASTAPAQDADRFVELLWKLYAKR